MSYDTAQPYLAAYVLLRRHNKVALVLRQNTGWMDGHYGLVSGKAEKGERITAATVREALEEAGVKIKESDLKYVHTCHRKAEDEYMSWIDILFEAEVWEGEPYNAEPTVHGELKWADIDKLPENLVPAVRHYLEQIRLGNMFSEFGWEEN